MQTKMQWTFESKITLNEVTKSINSQINNKALGNDGLTAEFHKHTSNEPSLILLDVYEIWEKLGTMGVISTARIITAFINLDYKNLNYKIYTTILKNPKQKVLDAIIGENQSAAIKNRTVLDVFSTTEDVTDVSNKLNSNLILISLNLFHKCVLLKFILLVASLVMDTNSLIWLKLCTPITNLELK